jgi:hypothetical protein
MASITVATADRNTELSPSEEIDMRFVASLRVSSTYLKGAAGRRGTQKNARADDKCTKSRRFGKEHIKAFKKA